MKKGIVAVALAMFAYLPAVYAQDAAVTGTCKDGTTTSAAKKRGACKGHGGVKSWTGPAAATSGAAPAAAGTAPAAASAPAKAAAPAAKSTPAAGGGAGQVWVNSSSHVYHCQGDKWYGKTKAGSYMSESEAKSAGNHAAHGKACS